MNQAGLVRMLTPVQRLVVVVPASEQPEEILVRLREEATWTPGEHRQPRVVRVSEASSEDQGAEVVECAVEVHWQPLPQRLGKDRHRLRELDDEVGHRDAQAVAGVAQQGSGSLVGGDEADLIVEVQLDAEDVLCEGQGLGIQQC